MLLLKGVVPRNVIGKYDINMFTNKEVMANVKVFSKILCPRSRSSRGQGHQTIGLLKGLVPTNVVSKYEVNIFNNREVMVNVKVFGRTDGRTD